MRTNGNWRWFGLGKIGKNWKRFSWRHIASKGYGCPYWHFHADFEDNKKSPLLCLFFTVKNFKPRNKFFYFHSIWLSGIGITVYGVRKAMDTESGRNALLMILNRAFCKDVLRCWGSKYHRWQLLLDWACNFYSILSIQIIEYSSVMNATQVWPCNLEWLHKISV